MRYFLHSKSYTARDNSASFWCAKFYELFDACTLVAFKHALVSPVCFSRSRPGGTPMERSGRPTLTTTTPGGVTARSPSPPNPRHQREGRRGAKLYKGLTALSQKTQRSPLQGKHINFYTFHHGDCWLHFLWSLLALKTFFYFDLVWSYWTSQIPALSNLPTCSQKHPQVFFSKSN